MFRYLIKKVIERRHFPHLVTKGKYLRIKTGTSEKSHSDDAVRIVFSHGVSG